MPRGFPKRPRTEARYHTLVEDARGVVLRVALHQTRGNVTHAARWLGLERTYLLRLMRARGLRSVDFR